ncbi:hypothetical protein FB471_1366 [Amycolatopsis cihanbeyliensis]|uniref:Uncharacterized protein n=1 Tax=Amycolatopsis cihanbeyliensis TaxID=1128664 RepID=A0A542DF43_AMYCI|nr:hypothetical protein FB471_1366 [Amycolatopsis cihanbeyliensis]
MSGLAKRSLYRIQQGANVTLDSLIKISTSLGIDRVAYFLDEEVFRQVNAELAMLKELRQRNITSVRFREASAMALASATDYSELTELLTHIAQDVQRARSKVQPATASDHDAPERS